MLWTDLSAPFPFGKYGSGVLVDCSLCGTEATLFFLPGQYAQVFPLKHAPFCKVFAGLGSTNKSATSLLLLSDSRSVLAVSSPPCPLLHLSFYLNLWQELFSLSPCSIRLQWVPGHSFLLGDDSADELSRRGALLAPSANGHSLLLSFYLSRIGRIENPSCSACGHPSQDTSHLILHCPATDSLHRSLFGNFLSLYDL